MNSEFPQATILSTQTRSLHSTTVSDEYEISIWLPPDYDTSEQQYPTLYLLDSPFGFGLAVPVVLGHMWDGMVPEMIVVGIGKQIDSYDEWWPIRGRDYSPVVLPSQPGSGQAAAFLKFVDTELVPFIDSNFLTAPDNRVLWGHSLAGAFVLFGMFSKPDLFSRYIATSPALVLEGETLIDYQGGLPTGALFSETSLFVSVGSLDHEFGPHINAFTKIMQDRDYPDLDFKTAILEGYAHISASPPGFIRGLPAVFS
jgi:hypothetical protein